MLSFKVHELKVGDRYYILLPKLNSKQMELISDRLTKSRFSVRSSGRLSARSPEAIIHVEPSGTCWSTADPADAVLPAVPDMLACPKQKVPAQELQGMYFETGRMGRTSHVRLSTRVESFSNWDKLRASGASGLSPDEHHVASFLIEEAAGNCQLLTDFPAEGSVPELCGSRLYFKSNIGATEALGTLGSAGRKRARNSYLPRAGILTLAVPLLSPRKLAGLFEELGEWCSFEAV
ncbi:MAG: hypothetical protein KGI38_05745 [Thaumarchaeota archaeon]|nr:hypothetical protein [Nitrososphaerota archaeon]